jgi:hypothetical protein
MTRRPSPNHAPTGPAAEQAAHPKSGPRRRPHELPGSVVTHGDFGSTTHVNRPPIIPARFIRAVPFKRYDRPGLCYLDKPEIDALLAAPDRTTEQGRRDHGVLLFLYNTGARASEAAAVPSGM